MEREGSQVSTRHSGCVPYFISPNVCQKAAKRRNGRSQFAAGAFSNQLYPSGILFAASVAVVVCLALGHMAGMKAKKEREAAQKS